MKTLLTSKQIEATLNDLAGRIVEDNPDCENIAIIGVRSRGEVLAQRLSKHLSQKLKREIPCGTLDITLYRDDLNQPQQNNQPKVQDNRNWI